jgi:hypothetical protein
MGFMWTPSILYDLFGGRYLMWEPSENVIELICSCRMERVLLLIGLPCAQSAPVASQFEVSSWIFVYWLKRCSFLSWILRSWIDPAVMLTSSA